jgi:ABC-type hemin transport system substrate-binding protein
MKRKKGTTTMATSKHPENQNDRDTKVQELLSILGELYQRVGYQHAAPANARLTGPDYRFMGYRPYTTEALRAAVPQVPVPMARGFFPGQPEAMTTPRVY